MKTKINFLITFKIFLALLFIANVFVSCNKDSLGNGYGNNVPPGSWVKIDNTYYQLSVSSVCYQGLHNYVYGSNTTLGTSSMSSLGCGGTASCRIDLYNYPGQVLTTNSKYSIANWNTSTNFATQIFVNQIPNGYVAALYGFVYISSTNGKITATFNDISFMDYNTNKGVTVSGVLICP